MMRIRFIFVLMALCATILAANVTTAYAYIQDPRVNGGQRVDADDIATALYVPSGIRGTFASAADADDVFRIRLFKGEKFYVAVQRDAWSAINVFLFGPNAQTVRDNDDAILIGGESAPDDVNRMRFIYDVPATGYYYINVWNPGTISPTGYTLYFFTEWGADNDLPPGVALPTSGGVPGMLESTWDLDDVFRVPLQAGDNFTAKIVDGDDWPDMDFDLYLYRPGAPDVSPDSDSYLVKSAKSTKTVGERLSFNAPAKGTYSLDVFAGRGGGDYWLEYSTLTAPAGPAKAAYCYLSPRVKPGTSPVSFMVYRKVGSTWRFYKSYPGKAVNAGARTKCVASFSLSPKYKWRVRTKTSAHGLGTRYSDYVSVTFR